MSVPSKPGLRQRKVAQRVNPLTSACPSSHLRKSYPHRLRLRHSPCCLQTCSLASTATGNALPAAGGIPRAAARPRRRRSWPAAARASDSESPPRGSYKRRQGLARRAELAHCRLAQLLPTPPGSSPRGPYQHSLVLDGAWPRPLTHAALACTVGRSSPTDAAPTAPARADSQSLPTITACSSCPRHQEGLSCPESNLPALMNKLCYSSARGVTPPLCGTGSHGQPTKRKLN